MTTTRDEIVSKDVVESLARPETLTEKKTSVPFSPDYMNTEGGVRELKKRRGK